MPKINYSNLNALSIEDLRRSETPTKSSITEQHQLESHTQLSVHSTDDTTETTNIDTNNNNIDLSSNSLSSSTGSSATHLDYKYAYDLAFSLDENSREHKFFLPNEPLHIDIVGHEEEPSLVVLHTNVYIINIKHGGYVWTIKRRYKMFLKLYEEYALFKTKYNLRHPAEKPHNSTFKSKDHFQLFFASFENDFSKAKYILEKFLNDVVQHSIFRYHNETLRFFEVSHLSFIHDFGDKNKEGIVQKRSGGYKVNVGCCSTFNCCLCWDNRWLIVKDSWIGYLHPNTGEIRAVLLVDHGFSVYNGLEETNDKCGLVIENLSRYLFTKCLNEKRASEWCLAIEDMLTKKSGKYFHSPSRYGSYAPIREQSQVKWFVDGADYMESIADAIELAKEEIFITGFFISPEIYLKRPVITGDKYRLDTILKRKAQEGVKVYILIYKEVEFALRINSAYSKRIFTLAHENIKVLRHPDHMKEQLNSILWAHHEKLLIIDQSIAFLGGVDLCYGRWDCFLHKLTDLGSVLPTTSPKVTTTTATMATVTIVNNPAVIDTCDVTTTTISTDTSSNSINTGGAELSAIMEPIQNEAKQFQINGNTAIVFRGTPAGTATTAFNHIEPNANFFSISNSIRTATSSLEPFNTRHRQDGKKYNYHENPNFDNILEDYYTNESTTDVAASTRRQKKPGVENNKKSFMKLKRSKSLEIDDFNKKKLLYQNSGENDTESLYKVRFNNRLRLFKESINTKLSTIKRENIELTLMNKFKKVKELKESIKRYTLQRTSNNFDTNSEIDPNESVTDQHLNEVFHHNSDARDYADMGLQGSSKLWFGKDYTNFIIKDFDDLESPYQDLIDRKVMPRMPWHDISACAFGDTARDCARHFIQRWNYTKMKKVRNNTHFPLLLPKSYDVADEGNDKTRATSNGHYIYKNFLRNNDFVNCRVQCLRSVCQWSAGLSTVECSIHTAIKDLIMKAKYYVYIENQFFISLIDNASAIVRNEVAQCIYERILRAHQNNEKFKVYVFVPLIPGYEGEYGRASGITLQAITHYNNLSINNLYKKLKESSINPRDYICFFSLRTWSVLNGKLITELIYVHSKLIIIDDLECIIGSANINDRSLLGTRDSEFALHIEDTDLMDGRLNDVNVKVGKFCSSLRIRLFREFLGELSVNFIKNSKYYSANDDNLNLISGSSLDLTDPCTDDFYENVLITNATRNTNIYKDVFNVIPCDTIATFEKLKEVKRKISMHTNDTVKAREELAKIKGYIVLYPNLFLCDEDLKPPLLAKEKFLPTSTFV